MTGHWTGGPMLAFDLETTGVDVETARIVTAALIEIIPGKPVETTQLVVDPGVEIPEAAAAVHGWTNERVRAHPDTVDPKTATDQIADHLLDAFSAGVPVVIYNAPYDLTVLDREMRRHTGSALISETLHPVVDPLVIDKHIDPYRRGSRKLTDVCAHYRVRLDQAHDSAADALAAARLAYRVGLVLSDAPFSIGELSDLYTAQIGWKAEQAESFAAYLRRQGKDASDVDGAWPIRPFPEATA